MLDDKANKDSLPAAILFIGIQASGKSSFYHEYFSQQYAHINLDTLHTRHRESCYLQECFEQKKSFVVDNTNPTAKDRERYIIPAREYGYHIIGYFFQSILSDCIARNQTREGKACVPNKAVAATSNKLELPSYQEGFHKLYFVKVEHSSFKIENWRE